MPVNPLTRPAIPLRVFSREEHAELRRLANDRGASVNELLRAELVPLKQLLQERLAAAGSETPPADARPSRTDARKPSPAGRRRRSPRADELPPRQPHVYRLHVGGE